MDVVFKTEPREQGEHFAPKRPPVFLDTNVIIGYLRGEPSAAQLFFRRGRRPHPLRRQPDRAAGTCFSPADAAGAGPEFERIRDHLRVLPVDLAEAEALLPRVRASRASFGPSPTTSLILSMRHTTATSFLVTRDALLKNLGDQPERPQVVTP